MVEAAFEIARKQGMEQVIVKSIAGRLGCSVQPIYSYCNNMDGLRQDVVNRMTASNGIVRQRGARAGSCTDCGML